MTPPDQEVSWWLLNPSLPIRAGNGAPKTVSLLLEPIVTFTFPPSNLADPILANPTSAKPTVTDLGQLRQHFAQALLVSREATLSLVEGLTPAQLSRQVHADFSPIGWHLGHIGFKEELWLLHHLAGVPLEKLTYQTPEYRRLF
jgi:hypothetical protein